MTKSMPPLVRNSLLEKPGFLSKYGLEEFQLLHFDPLDISISCSEAFAAFRNALSSEKPGEVTDKTGNKWKIEAWGGKDVLPNLTFVRGDERYPARPAFVLLSRNVETRLRSFEIIVSEINLPDETRDAWRSIIEKRPLEDDEMNALLKDLEDTSANIADSIRRGGASGHLVVRSLVPSSRRYFERLVGKYHDSQSIHDYAEREGAEFLRKLSSSNPVNGFLSSLLLSSHSALTAQIQLDGLNNDEIVRAYDFLERHGDTVSQLGAIEVGLRTLPSRPDIEPRLVGLVRKILDDDTERKTGGFRLFSALFVFVDGKLSRTRTLSSEPPFYRRLAAFSHAALIHRQLVNSINDISSFHELLFKESGGDHFLQSLVDMRTEPCWNPVLGTDACVRANFLDRIVRTTKENERNIKNSELYDLVLGKKSGNIRSTAHALFPHPPDPLDGTGKRLRDLPAETDNSIRTQVTESEPRPSSFAAIVNSAYVFRLDSSHAEAAAKAVRSCDYRLSSLESESQLTAVLNGLATVAAVTRSHELANEVRILVRVYRSNARVTLPVAEEIPICLTAAASRSDADSWREFVGDWLTETASELKEDEAATLRVPFQYLCHLVPDLWISCGGTYAALAALARNQA